MRSDIDTIWERLRRHEGEVFTQIRGGTFTYRIEGESVHLSRTDWSIPKRHIAEALELVPLPNTVPVQHLYAPSYMYALLMDDRVKGTDW